MSAKWLTPSERVIRDANPKMPTYRHRSSDHRERYPSRESTGPIGGTAKPDTPTYSGTEVIGVATMHKSNAVPVTGKKDATEVARMRRG